MVAKIESLSRWRGLVLRLVVLAQIGIYAVVLAFLILSPPLARRTLRLLQGLLLALLAVPLALLFGI